MTEPRAAITQHPWTSPLTERQAEALWLISLATKQTQDFVNSWCVQENGWHHDVGSLCEAAMHNPSYLRSDRSAVWGHGPFRTMNWDLGSYVLSATDLLAGVGVLCANGAYAGQTTLPCVRASFERSITVVWILNFELHPQQVYARSVLERIGALDFAIASAPTTARRNALKRVRKQARKDIHELFNGIEDTRESGLASDLTIAEQRHINFTERSAEFADRAIDGSGISDLYGSLSFFSHPNVVGDSMFRSDVKSNNVLITADIGGVAKAAHNAMATLGTALTLLGEWMGWPTETVDTWSDDLGSMWSEIHTLAE